MLEVGEENVSGLTLVLDEEAEIGGRIAIDGSDEGCDLSHAVVSVTPTEPVFPFFRRRSSEVEEDLTFHITNVPSGPVRFRVSLPPGNFYVESIRLRGMDVVEQPFRLAWRRANQRGRSGRVA